MEGAFCSRGNQAVALTLTGWLVLVPSYNGTRPAGVKKEANHSETDDAANYSTTHQSAWQA